MAKGYDLKQPDPKSPRSGNHGNGKVKTKKMSGGSYAK